MWAGLVIPTQWNVWRLPCNMIVTVTSVSHVPYRQENVKLTFMAQSAAF